ncbi:MAG: ATP-binding protein [candidate division KSB1 bacterium]|nr:ATP-binding protein [candidate division KSB1 bacterium]MDZ7302829.1 ATP-binding protein [candidate division KSB1 bacterium]MDZ7311846.1 ATP-binding protein [candidate division KSB1 bacterium]
MDVIYPHSLRTIFTNREHELRFLQYLKTQHLQGNTQHCILFGLRRIGKTLLLKEFVRRTLAQNEKIVPVYIDLEDITSSPENFAIGYVGMICFWFLTRGKANPESYLRMSSLFTTGMRSNNQAIQETLDYMHREMERAKANRMEMLRTAFNFPEQLARTSQKKFIIILDEFQFIQLLRNFYGVSDPIAQFRAHLERQSSSLYVLAGSAISVLNRLVADEQSPIFLQFQKLLLRPFKPEDTTKLALKLLPQVKRDMNTLQQIYRLSLGNPFYVIQICQRLLQLETLHDIPITPEAVEQAFLIETLSSQGRIYDYCRYIYDTSIQRSKGRGALKFILQLLAEEEGLTLTEIARRMKVTAPTASEYLRWLLEVDLIVERDKKYFFEDTVFKYWLLHSTKGIEVDAMPRTADLWGLVKKLDENFQKATSELGIAIEGKIFQIMQAFAGQEIEQNLFFECPLQDKVILPKFKNIRPYRSADNSIEIDFLAENNKRWAVEIKWKNKAADLRELKKFHTNAKELADVLWFISKSGFTNSAVAFAKENQILLSDLNSIEDIAERLEVRFVR